MDITVTVLTKSNERTDPDTGEKIPWHERGDITHIESYTGLTSVHPRLVLLHVMGISGRFGGVEQLKELYLPSLKAAVDGEIIEVRSRKHNIDLDDPELSGILTDRNFTISQTVWNRLIRAKTL